MLDVKDLQAGLKAALSPHSMIVLMLLTMTASRLCQFAAAAVQPVPSTPAKQSAPDPTSTLPPPPVRQLVVEAGVLAAGALFRVVAERREAHTSLVALIT